MDWHCALRTANAHGIECTRDEFDLGASMHADTFVLAEQGEEHC